MQTLGRRYSSVSVYRYGLNGQEKDGEINPEGNITTALYWEYDSRIGRRWNTDPVLKVWESPYSCFSNNPILKSDPNGDTDSIPPKMKSAVAKIIARTSLVIGVNGIKTLNPVDHKGPTVITPLYGGVTPYGSTFAGGPDEPNSFIQLLYSLKNGNEVGLHWMKNKIEPFASGLKYEAPTTLDVIYGHKFKESNLNKSFKISGNGYAGAGVLLAAPFFASGNGRLVNPPPILARLGDDYRVVGLSAVVIARVDITYLNRISIFIAGTAHHMNIFAQKTTVGNEPVKLVGLVSAAAGVKIRL
jgi:hypothetical protein